MQVMQSSRNVKHKCWAGESEILVALDPLSSRLLRYISSAHDNAHMPIACSPFASSDFMRETSNVSSCLQQQHRCSCGVRVVTLTACPLEPFSPALLIVDIMSS